MSNNLKFEEGDIEVVRRVYTRHECEVCGEPATKRHTYLLPNARSNRASSAYGRDDCTWCSDDEKFTCDEHPREPRNEGYGWCSTFTYNSQFCHMFLYWRQLSRSKEPNVELVVTESA